MSIINTYIDESGSIPKDIDKKHRYFIIVLVHVKNQDRAAKNFKRYRLKAIKDSSELKKELAVNKEIKGSSVSEQRKQSIYSNLVRLCDDLEIGIIVMDTTKVSDKFRTNKARCFNYLLGRYFITYSNQSDHYSKDMQISLQIDEQNVATKSTFVLREYLNTELVLYRDKYDNDFNVTYYDSKNCLLVQLADFIANTTYRYLEGGNVVAKENLNILKSNVIGKDFFKFPCQIENKL